MPLSSFLASLKQAQSSDTGIDLCGNGARADEANTGSVANSVNVSYPLALT